MQQKSLKARDNPFEENTKQGVTKSTDKGCKICDIIIEGKSYTIKNSETKFKINKDLSCNSKNLGGVLVV